MKCLNILFYKFAGFFFSSFFFIHFIKQVRGWGESFGAKANADNGNTL